MAATLGAAKVATRRKACRWIDRSASQVIRSALRLTLSGTAGLAPRSLCKVGHCFLMKTLVAAGSLDLHSAYLPCVQGDAVSETNKAFLPPCIACVLQRPDPAVESDADVEVARASCWASGICQPGAWSCSRASIISSPGTKQPLGRLLRGSLLRCMYAMGSCVSSTAV